MLRSDDDDEEEEGEVAEEDEEFEEEVAEEEEGGAGDGEEDHPDDVAAAGFAGEHALDVASGDFFCYEMRAEGLPREDGVPTEEELFANLKCQPGFKCTRQELSEDLRTLMGLGLFEDVTATVDPIPGTAKSKLTVRFDQKIWPRMQSFKVNGATVLPPEVEERVMEEQGKTEGPSNMRTLALIKNVVEKWYQDRGYPFSYIQTYDGMDTGEGRGVGVAGSGARSRPRTASCRCRQLAWVGV